MRLNNVEGFESKDIIMAKFTESQWAEDFLNGDLYMNNFNHFIEQEKRTKEKGQGDSYEAALVTEVQNIKIYNNDDKLIATGEGGTIIERYVEVKQVPLFCTALFKPSDFKVMDINDKKVKFMLDIPLEEKEK